MRKIKKDIEEEGENNSKLIAFLATFLSIVGFLIYLLVKNKTDYSKFYAKQGLVVFVTSVLAGIIGRAVFMIPILGHIIKIGLDIVVVVLWVLSWVYALSGKMKEVPLIGKYAKNINL